MSKRANHPTALLPFPEPSSQAVAFAGVAASPNPPIRLDQLDLRQMRNESAAPRYARQASANGVGRRSAFVPAADLTAPTHDTRVRAVQPSASLDFYLDLVGAVTVMALVLLAAILV